MNGTINIPSVISIFKEIADYTPIIATSELFYEAKALELIACLVDWHIQESLSPSVRSICDADREAIHRLIHFYNNIIVNLWMSKILLECAK